MWFITQRRLGWAPSAQLTEPSGDLIERGGLELDLWVGPAHFLEDGDEPVGREVVVSLPWIVPMIGGDLAFEDVPEPVRLDPVHVPDETTQGCTGTDWGEGQTLGVDALDLVDEGVAVIVEPATERLALVEGLHRDKRRALVHGVKLVLRL